MRGTIRIRIVVIVEFLLRFPKNNGSHGSGFTSIEGRGLSGEAGVRHLGGVVGDPGDGRLKPRLRVDIETPAFRTSEPISGHRTGIVRRYREYIIVEQVVFSSAEEYGYAESSHVETGIQSPR